MSDMSASILATVSVADALADALRTQILDGQWPPGSSVPEVEVARLFGVSRPTAKTAVRTLVHEGLLRQDAHRAPYVPRLTDDDVADLFFVRMPLELAIVERLCARPSAAGLAAAAEHIERLRALPPDAPTSTFIAADLGFHRALADATQSQRMRRAYATLAGEIHLNMIQTRQALGRDRIVREHSAIHDAIAAGDLRAARRHAREHLGGALSALTGSATDQD
jgi:DNA-binding GntR family transcriptional regulator